MMMYYSSIQYVKLVMIVATSPARGGEVGGGAGEV